MEKRTQPKAMSQTFRKDPSKLIYRSGEGHTLGAGDQGGKWGRGGKKEKLVGELKIMDDFFQGPRKRCIVFFHRENNSLT